MRRWCQSFRSADMFPGIVWNIARGCAKTSAKKHAGIRFGSMVVGPDIRPDPR